MRFVSHRPRYPAGAPVPGFPAIRQALYADSNCEVYLLQAAGSRNLLLIGARQQDDADAPSIQQLQAWLESHGCELLATMAPAPGVRDIVVRVRGAWMAEIPVAPMTEHELYALLIALIDLAADAARVGLTAAPIRPLLWIEGPLDVRRLASVYVRAGAGRESAVVGQIGQTFLYAATGISSIEMERQPDEERFLAWCQNADPGLARIVHRCIGSSQPITTLYELRRQVTSSLLGRAPARSLLERTASRYINLSPHRYLRLSRPEGQRL